jgi:hypothetical protein
MEHLLGETQLRGGTCSADIESEKENECKKNAYEEGESLTCSEIV